MKYTTRQFENRSWKSFIDYILRYCPEALLILRDRKGGNPYRDSVTNFLPAKEPMTISVHEIFLPTRARHGLDRLGIKTLGDLVTKSSNDLLGLRNFGKRSLQAVVNVLHQHGLSLGPEKDSLRGKIFLANMHSKCIIADKRRSVQCLKPT